MVLQLLQTYLEPCPLVEALLTDLTSFSRGQTLKKDGIERSSCPLSLHILLIPFV
jgi:hypothetical protein